jgi:hypothetical protein
VTGVFRLPSYARPAFVRLVRELDVTGTYKLKKRDLQVPFIFYIYFFEGGRDFFFVLNSALLHLPPLRFHCADGCSNH